MLTPAPIERPADTMPNRIASAHIIGRLGFGQEAWRVKSAKLHGVIRCRHGSAVFALLHATCGDNSGPSLENILAL